MDKRFADQAARAMRIIAAYDSRTPDEFEVRALAMAMAKNPRLDDGDYEDAIVEYHQQPRSRMRAGHLIEGAKKVWERRTESRAIETGGNVSASPKPDNYRHLVNQLQVICREFRDQGVDPTNEDLLKEHARRVRQSQGRAA